MKTWYWAEKVLYHALLLLVVYHFSYRRQIAARNIYKEFKVHGFRPIYLDGWMQDGANIIAEERGIKKPMKYMKEVTAGPVANEQHEVETEAEPVIK